MNEYSQHLEKQIQAQQAGRACPPDFDFNKAIPEFFSKSYYRLIRNIWNFLTRKAYEAIFVAQLSPKLADRLTKDISKSISRKLTKYSQQETSRRIFWTCLHGSLLRALSLFTVDCGYAIYQYLMNENKEKRAKTPKGKNKASPTHVAVSLTSPSTLLNILIWTGKRAIFHTLSILFFSGGYSVGLMVSPKYTPVWFATLFESLGGAILAPLLC